MATILVKVSEEEKLLVLKAIEATDGEISSVAKIALMAKMSKNKTRFVIEDLVNECRVTKRIMVSFNNHYSRYVYSIGGSQ